MLIRVFALIVLLHTLTACTAVSLIDVAASTAVDVTVGAVKATGKVVGKVVDVVTPDGDDD